MPRQARQTISSLRRGKDDVHWKAINTDYSQAIPKNRFQDIVDQSSLTHRLIKASGGGFSVNVCREAWRRPSFSERKCLGLKERQYAFIREVELIGKGEVWVVARSVIPKNTLKGKLKHLENLGNRPLGASLFKDPSLERTLFEVSKFCTKNLITNAKVNDNIESWGRRSMFRLQGKSVLVAEIFLPCCPLLNN